MKKKSSSKKPVKKSSKSKRNFANIGQYLVAKDGKTKYIKLGVHGKKASKEAKALVKKLIQMLGTDVLFLNLFDADFREKYDIQDFVKGNLSVDLDAKDTDSDDEDESEDDDQDDSDDDSDDEESDDDDDSEDDEDSDDDDEEF